jgi:hypothetical protein
MSLLINDDLIWISVPKCASLSIEHALIDSELDIKLFLEYKYNLQKLNRHMHFERHLLFNEFGIRPTLCITRNWFDRWISALEFIWRRILNTNLTPIVQWDEIDNNFIYKTFDTDFYKKLHYSNFQYDELFKKLNTTPEDINNSIASPVLSVLLSQNYWKENQPCTYEFDIKELHKFEEFIQKRYGVSFNLEHLNSTPKIKNKIEINDELKNHLWNVFEKPFEKRNSLI